MLEIQSAALTDCGCIRKKNEDRISTYSNQGVFVLVDGMGGERCGGTAADQAILAVEEYLQNKQSKTPSWQRFEYEATLTDSQNAVMNMVRLANYRVWEAAQKLEDCQGMGATISVLQIQNDTATIGNIGDSRVYISRDSLSFHFQELPQTIHCPHDALVNHRITGSDLDVGRALCTKALNSAIGYFRLFEVPSQRLSVDQQPPEQPGPFPIAP